MVKRFVWLLRWIWKILQPIGFVWGVIGIFGWVPIMLGVIGAILAFLKSLDPLFIFFALIGGYAIGIIAVNQGTAWRQRKNKIQGQVHLTQERKPERRMHDGVLWEHTGRHYQFSGMLLAEGPLCPKDYCPLSLRYGEHRRGREEVRADNHDDEIISNDYYHAVLFCPECKARYTFGKKKEKTLGQSRNEVESLFEGMHRRDTNVQEGRQVVKKKPQTKAKQTEPGLGRKEFHQMLNRASQPIKKSEKGKS